MKTVLYILISCAVVAVAFWAYRENYATQHALHQTDELHRDIRQAHARLAVLRAEWAYLNRPDRLQELTDLNFNALGLLPLRSDQFGGIADITKPAPPPLVITNPIEVSNVATPEVSP